MSSAPADEVCQALDSQAALALEAALRMPDKE